MSQHRWTSAVVLILTVSLFSGCQNSGRFTRRQYAELDADPFLAAESDPEYAGGDHTPAIQTASAMSETKEAFRFENVGANGVDPGSLTKAPLKRPVTVSAESAYAVKNFDSALVDRRPDQTIEGSFSGLTDPGVTSAAMLESSTAVVADIGTGFDEWLLKQPNHAAQASTQIQKVAYESEPTARPEFTADFSVFPGQQQSVEIKDPVAYSQGVEENPFDHQHVLSRESSESPDDSFTPPEGFSFP
ncbi:MAG: hypothetical protein MK102_16105 [Fuerstiella sp.]|nr:hypothetical protein [Fuerstiella sp.]